MKKEKNTTPSGEDYLEAILILQRQKGLVRPVDIARHMEFDVFHLLARRPGRVFSQREIYEFAAPDSFDSSWTGISSIIYKLRHKLNADFIQTVYGKGYKFLPP